MRTIWRVVMRLSSMYDTVQGDVEEKSFKPVLKKGKEAFTRQERERHFKFNK